MISVCLIFFALSLGTLVHISFGSEGYNLQIVEIVILLIYSTTLVTIWKKGLRFNSTLAKITYSFLWFLCFIYSLLTFFWSNQGLSVLPGSVNLFYGLIAFVVAEYHFRENTKIFVTANRLFIISLFIQLSFNMVQGIRAEDVSFYTLKYHSTTLLGNSNYIAFFFTFDLIYEFILKEKSWLLFVLINLLGIVLTMSRGAIISILVALLVYFIISLFNKNIKTTKSFSIFFLLLIVFYSLISYTKPGVELWNGLRLGLGASSVHSRQILWGNAISQILSQPFGNGIVWEEDPHNVVLSSFRNLGVVFGTIYLLLISLPLFYFFRRKIFSLSINSIAVLIAYLTVFVHSMIEVFYFGSTSIIWTAIVISFIFRTLKNDNQTLGGYL